MPRIAKHESDKGVLAARKWREGLKSKGRPETDAVDSAIAAAVSVYMHTAVEVGSVKDVRKASALELMAINNLLAPGSSKKPAELAVSRRARAWTSAI